jgi:hypothetical protein
MKKIYLVGMLCLATAVSAQTTRNVSPQNQRSATIKHEPAHDVVVPVVVNPNNVEGRNGQIQFKTAPGVSNDRVGTTFALNQTNGSTYRRVTTHPDGKISVTWTASMDNGANGFFTRGSGFNHFNGTQWASQPNGLRIEQVRTGFPALVRTATEEIIVSHKVDTGGGSGGLLLNRNGSIGGTTWTPTNFATPPANTVSPLWPRAAVSGDFLIIIATYQDSSANQPIPVTKNGVRNPLVYFRYNLATNTWVDEDLTLPGYDTTLLNRGGTDNYSIDANGNNVAVLVGGVFNSLVLWKSGDNGATWDMTIIDTFPAGPGYVFDRDPLPTSQVNNGSVHVMLDNDNRAHVFSGLAQISDSVFNDGSYTFSWSRIIGGVNDAILYWREGDTSLRSIANAVGRSVIDSNYSEGVFAPENRYGISNSTWPSAAIDSSGRIYLVYSALTAGDGNGLGANFRDIICVHSSDNGDTWSAPINLTAHLAFNREEIYPMAAKFVGDKLNISYLNKISIGTQVPATSNEVFQIHMLSVPVERLTSGTVGLSAADVKLYSISQNYPNPARGITNIDVNLVRNSDVTITITDVLGKTMLNQRFENLASGVNTCEINLASFRAGIYFYSVEVNGVKETRRMIVE